MKRTALCSAGGWLAAAALPVFAAPALENFVVRPNPASFAGATPPQLEFVVTVKRGPLDTQHCEIMIDPGNPGGRQVPRLAFNMGGERTQSVRYVFERPGTYRVTARGFSGCSGSRTVTVNVRASDGGAKPAVAAAPAPKCPGGWEIVPESVQGARYSCRAKAPARPIACAGGTSYFAERGLIGCR